MRVWRLVATRHAARAMSGEGAAEFGGRWNPVGRRMVYTADSLALATLELSVHLTGARITYTAIEVEVPDHLVDVLEVTDLRRGWPNHPDATARVGDAWARSGRSPALAVPSALVDARSDERNVLIDPAHPAASAVQEVQRFEVTLDERL
jgi:RES domain-containing protein